MAKEKGIVNIVFNKIVGSLKNIVRSKNIETRLKKWRSGIKMATRDTHVQNH